MKLSSFQAGKLLRIAIGSALAILVADALSLQYSASAGIITLLTIQNTKKETLVISSKRLLSFGVALFISTPLFYVFGYHPFVFGLFLLLFVGISELLSLSEGIAMNAVLTTHFLIEQTMSLRMIYNELLILLIGMSIGVGLNLLMFRQTKQAREWIDRIDEKMKRILHQLAATIRGDETFVEIHQTRLLIQQAQTHLDTYQANHLREDVTYFTKYAAMRVSQLNVLQGIYEITQQIIDSVSQSIPVADFLDEIAISYHEHNETTLLFERYEEILSTYQKSELPSSRKEFEERARLFQIVIMIKQFLLLKRQFIHEMHNE